MDISANTSAIPHESPALRRRDFMRLAAAAAGTAAAVHVFGSGTASAAHEPTIALVSSTATSITIDVTAGSTTTPGGFFVVVLDQAIYASAANPWAVGNILLPPNCKTVFTSSPLVAGSTVRVTVATCGTLCGTAYAVRAHLNDPQVFTPSNILSNIVGAPCDPPPPPPAGGCTYTQGYWKTHGPTARGNNSNEWPVSSLLLGSRSYTAAELQRIFDQSVQGNGLVSLAHQLIAAKLNVADGASSAAIAASIVAADALIGALVVPPVGTGSLPTSTTSALVDALTSYNEGATGPGHC